MSTATAAKQNPFDAPFSLLLHGPLGGLLENLESLPETIMQLRGALLLPGLAPERFDAIVLELAQAESALQDAREAAECICDVVLALSARSRRPLHP